MEKEDQIIAMLEKQGATLEKHTQILAGHGKMLERQGKTLDSHGKMLESHSKMLESQGETLDGHGKMLESQGETLDGHGKMLDSHSKMLESQGNKLEEHSQILTALRSGQEHLKAELDGLKVSTAKEFGNLREELSETNARLEVSHEDIWNNKVDIKRIKRTMGME